MPGLASGSSSIGSRYIIGRFYQTLEETILRSWVEAISMYFGSDQDSETYKWLGMSPAMREWIGGRNPQGLRQNGITIENKTYEASLEVSVDDLRRDKTGQLRVRIDELAVRAVQHWMKLLTTLIEDGESTNGYDSQYFFDDDHSEGSSGTQTNDLDSDDYSELNVTTSTNPTADELADVIMKMIQHLFTLKDDQGEPMNNSARQFLVMVPIPFLGAAAQALRSKQLDTGSGTRDNPLLNEDWKISLAANPRLTWTTKLALFRTDGRAKPFIRQEEEGVYGVKAIRNVGYGYWQYAILATLS